METKLETFPNIYALVLDGEEGKDRRESFIKKAKELNLNYHIYKTKRYPKCNTIIEGNIYDHISFQYPHQDKTTLAVTANHLKMIRYWLKTTDSNEEWAVFCEGDISFETVKYWPFKWGDLMGKLPNDTKVLQMCVITNTLDYDLNITKRTHLHWGANIYLLSREYAEVLIKRYCTVDDNTFNMSTVNLPLGAWGPCLPEDVLFINNNFKSSPPWIDDNGFYICPLFIEDIKHPSYFKDVRKEPDLHLPSHEYTLKLWKELKNKLNP